jgi:NAD(P)-dependent dehydrogenase (short-subunit alcohol dehydrogenase family)
MTWTITDSGSQAGRLAIVTGANIGLGYDTALALAGQGCSVILACRNLDKAEAARARIVARHKGAHIECMVLDLSSLKSVRSFAAAFARRHQALDLLINNAGIMMPPYATLRIDRFAVAPYGRATGVTHCQPEQPCPQLGRNSF